ncbi:MAG: hypothetical protein KatS3mg008_0999 [Acidimicrobiales bacterium]|nr:MAG: hypothetical protein KatS3mg008_0999 [Acidimicrobiales bacterium]
MTSGPGGEWRRHLLALMDELDVGILVIEAPDPDEPASFRIAYVNHECAVFAGREASTMVGARLRDALRFPTAGLEQVVAHALDTGSRLDVRGVPLSAAEEGLAGRKVDARIYPVADAVVVCFRPVPTARAASELMRHRALHDPLTGLPNRLLLSDRTTQGLRQAKRTGSQVAMLVADLDNFSEINDTLGHRAGDRLLVELGRRLERNLRECDTVCRIGADEFAVLMTTGVTPRGVEVVAEKLGRVMSENVDMDGLSIRPKPAIGWAVADDEVESDELLRRAEVAMFKAKKLRRPAMAYTPEMDVHSLRRLELLGQLERAIRDDQLMVHYQPVVDVRDRSVAWVEALVRWAHPLHGTIPPSTFVELAEVGGLSIDLVEWVSARAISDARKWLSKHPKVGVSVNTPVDAVTDESLPRRVRELLSRWSHPPELFGVELTESQVMEDPLAVVGALGELRAAGVTTSVDDFGTGYSSFAYLRQLPIDELKIDRSFVARMCEDPTDATIVRSLVELGHRLGLRVVAEGVEDDRTLRALRDAGSDRAQGFSICRPLPPDELVAWMSSRG